MHRIDTLHKDVDKFGSGKHGYQLQYPLVDTPTETDDDAFDAVQEEILSVVEAVGITPVKGTNNQLAQALGSIFEFSSVLNLEQVVTPADAAAIAMGGIAEGKDGMVVLVGANDGSSFFIMTNNQGSGWVRDTSLSLVVDLFSVASDKNNLFIAVGAPESGKPAILQSVDNGYTWTRVAVFPDGDENVPLLSITLGKNGSGANLFCAVGASDGAKPYIVTSTNGASWAEQTPTVARNIDATCVAHNGTNLFCAVGAKIGGDALILTSPNGTTWTERANPSDLDLYGVAYGNGRWVAVGEKDGSKPYMITSTDGTTWVACTTRPSINKELWSVSYGNGLWLAFGPNGPGLTGGFLCYSFDGLDWYNIECGQEALSMRGGACVSISANKKRWYFSNDVNANLYTLRSQAFQNLV